MTPLVKLQNFYLKREDLNSTGSIKDRAIPEQIKRLLSLGYHQAVISSTGNAAISAQHFCHQNNLDLTIFVSPKTNPAKLKLIKNYQISSTPISDAIKFSQSHHAYLLRQSTDPIALTAYSQVAVELLSQLPQTTSIYLPVGSGATLVGIHQKLPQNVKIFAVQSAFNPTLTRLFDPKPPETTNLTDALTVRSLPLKPQILKSINHGFTINNQQIITTQKLLQSHHIFTSNEGALALAAFLQSQESGGDFPVILLTGSPR